MDDFVQTAMGYLILKAGSPKGVKEKTDSREFNTNQPIAGHWFLLVSGISGCRGLLFASRGHFSDNGCVSVTSPVVRVRVLVASRGHFTGRSTRHSWLPHFPFPNFFADKMERWCCTIKKCKYYIKCNESREIWGREECDA